MQQVVGKLVKVDDIQFVTNIDPFLVHCMYARAHNVPERATPILSWRYSIFKITENLQPLKGQTNTIFRPVCFADRFVRPNTYSKFGPKSFLQKRLVIMPWRGWTSLWVPGIFHQIIGFSTKLLNTKNLLLCVVDWLLLVSLHNHNVMMIMKTRI